MQDLPLYKMTPIEAVEATLALEKIGFEYFNDKNLELHRTPPKGDISTLIRIVINGKMWLYIKTQNEKVTSAVIDPSRYNYTALEKILNMHETDIEVGRDRREAAIEALFTHATSPIRGAVYQRTIDKYEVTIKTPDPLDDPRIREAARLENESLIAAREKSLRILTDTEPDTLEDMGRRFLMQKMAADAQKTFDNQIMAILYKEEDNEN